tara:strand:- start:81 stop:1121 length:1041 start_codon:yes stop_codon:yes gene_type:complete
MNLKVESNFRPIRKIGCVYGQSRSVNDRLNDFNKHHKATDPTTKWYPKIIWKVSQNVLEKETWIFDMLENRCGIKRLSRNGKKSEQFVTQDDTVNIINTAREIMKFVGTEFYFKDDIELDIEDKTENIKISRADTPPENRKRTINDVSERKAPTKRRKYKTKKDRLYKYLHPHPSQSTSIRFGSLKQAKQIIYNIFTDFGVELWLREDFKDNSENWSFVLPDQKCRDPQIGIDLLLLFLPRLLIKKLFGSVHFTKTTIGKFHYDSCKKIVKKLRNNYIYDNGQEFTSIDLNEFKKDIKELLSLNSNLSLIHQNHWGSRVGYFRVTVSLRDIMKRNFASVFSLRHFR